MYTIRLFIRQLHIPKFETACTHEHFTQTTFYQRLEENKMSKNIHVHYAIIYNTIIYTPVLNSPSSAIINSISNETRKKTFLCLKKGVYGVWVITMLSMHEHFTLTTFYQCLERNKMSRNIHVHYAIIHNTITYTPV